ncbi:BRO-N domain-containing protein [Peribacillus sp. FSL M8-0224]|uniref:BRO-N domain-containing protein n=1 Tax=Peribacillus sp. FSL M8-0224 TaxID=2921568 RepID=UPI0030F7621D
MRKGSVGFIACDTDGMNEVRTIMKDGEPWFVSKDVCEVLEIGNPSQALNRLDRDEKGICLLDTLGGKQSLTSVNEMGLYTLVLGS